MSKRIVASVYTHGRFCKGFREILDTDKPFLYSAGVYESSTGKPTILIVG